MSLVLDGTGTSGLAIISLRQTEREAYRGQLQYGQPIFWGAIPRDRMGDVLKLALFEHGEEIDESKVTARTDSIRDLLAARGIRVVLPIGSLPLRAVSPLHGQARKLIGATIQSDTLPYLTVPLETQASGVRALRSFMWSNTLREIARRAWKLARMPVQIRQNNLFHWQEQHTGQSDAIDSALTRILDSEDPVGVDLETAGIANSSPISAVGLANRSVGISTPWASYTSRIYGHQRGLNRESTRKLVLAILASRRIPKLFHNGQFDITVLRSQGFEIEGEFHDTLLAHRIVYPDLYHNLQFVASHYFCLDPWKTRFEAKRKADIKRKSGAKGDELKRLARDWAECEPSELLHYNVRDASILPGLWEALSNDLDAGHRLREQYDHLRQLAGVAAKMQFHGVGIDTQERQRLVTLCEARMENIGTRWKALAPGVPLSGEGSKKLLHKHFFETLGAPKHYKKKDSKEPTLNAATLLEYDNKGDQLLGDTAFTYYEMQKIKKAYDAFLVPLTSDRVYARPNFAGTKGTRASYSDPNLQQWSKPKSIFRLRTKEDVKLAPPLRGLIIPDPGCVLGETDYNALELRLVAYAANIPEWLAWMVPGSEIDMHIEHVFRIFGKRVTKKDDPGKYRDIIKTLTFARFYNSQKTVGQVLTTLRPSMPDLEEDDLHEIFDKFDEIRPEIVQWQLKQIAFVKEHGYIETGLGGYRQQHDKSKPDSNQLLSFGIQSTGGCLINKAFLRINDRLDWEAGQRMLVQVHDAIIWQARPEHLDRVRGIVAEEMTRSVSMWGHQDIIFPVESKTGPSWAAAK